MSNPIGFLTILLVLNVGLLFVSIRPCVYGYYNENSSSLENQSLQKPAALVGQVEIASDDQLTKAASTAEVPDVGEPVSPGTGNSSRSSDAPTTSSFEVSNKQLENNDESKIGPQQEKRGLGMPASTMSHDLSSSPEEPNGAAQAHDDAQSDPTLLTQSFSDQNISEPRIGDTLSQQQQPLLKQQQETERQNQPTLERSFGSDLVAAIMNPAGSVSPVGSQQQQAQINPQQLVASPHVKPEELPTIIENNKQVSPPIIDSAQLGGQQQGIQEIQQQTSPQQQLSAELVQPGLVVGSNATGLPMSSARTFDGWTNCVGSVSNKYGTCKNDVECNKHKGRPDGSCMGGFGVCCVMALTCGDKSVENNTFFANPDFPEPSWEARLCEVELKKKSKKILQIMIEFEDFELAPPNQEGECITDVFQVRLASQRPSPYSLLRICGQNTGQHMYLDVSQIDEPLVLSVATSGGGFPRRWSIRIVQMDDKNYLLAPPGCLQYYTDTVGHFRSFNMGRNLRNLYYAICFRIDNGYSGIRFTENFFGMNGPFCRAKKPGPQGQQGISPNRYNGAHPHHLVIPPPGYSHPPPKPKFGHKGRFKRLAYKEAIDSAGADYRYTRTLTPEKELEKEYKKEGYGYGPPPPIYGPPPQQLYGPPLLPPPQYGYPPHEYGKEYGKEYKEYGKELEKEFKKEKFEEKFEEKKLAAHEKYGFEPKYGPPELKYGPPKYGPHPHELYGPTKFGEKYEKFEHKHEYKEEKPKGTWWNPLAWSSSKEVKEEEKAAKEYGSGYQYQYQQGGGAYGPTYAPQHGGYGPPPLPYHSHQHPLPPQYSYGPKGPVGYGPPLHPGYAGAGYHHKEIGKFGHKYEHLEYKHEKNHLGKKEEKKIASGSWWPSWGKKEEKKDKKDKYFQHHEALFPMLHIPEMPHCEPRFCGTNDVITFPPSGDSIAEMCGNRFNRGRGPKIISGSPLVVYVSNRGHTRGAGFDINYEQVFYIPKPY